MMQCPSPVNQIESDVRFVQEADRSVSMTLQQSPLEASIYGAAS